MRSLILFLSGAAAALICVWLASSGTGHLSGSHKNTFSSFDPPKGVAAVMRYDTGMLKLTNADLDAILNLYQEVSARTVIRSPNLPTVKISLNNQTALTRVETLQLLDTTLVENGITMVLVGDTSAKAVSNREAGAETPPTIDPVDNELPDSSSYMTCTVTLKKADPQQVITMLGVVARMPNSIMFVPSGNLLILRDYSANIRRMLGLLDRVDHQPMPWLSHLAPSTNIPGQRP